MAQGIFDRVRGELTARERSPWLSMSDLLTLPEPQSGLLTWMVRQEAVAFGDVIAFLGGDEAQARLVLADLLDKGLIRELERRGVTQYRVRLAPKRGRELPANLWQALDAKCEHGKEDQR